MFFAVWAGPTPRPNSQKYNMPPPKQQKTNTQKAQTTTTTKKKKQHSYHGQWVGEGRARAGPRDLGSCSLGFWDFAGSIN